MNVSVRQFVDSDRGALQRIYLAARSAAFTWADPDRHRMEDFDRDTRGEIVLVGCCEDRVAGFASIWKPENFLHNLFVHPSMQRRGVGQALLAYCYDYFDGTPTLKCVTANTPALQFYLAHGWKIVREVREAEEDYYLMEGEPIDSKSNPPD